MDHNGYTALMDAVTRSHTEVAKILIDAGANVQIKGHDGMTAVDIAKRNNDGEMVRMLTEAEPK
ncbi:MAG TPA: ankyrin repeat domain-containing protein [Oculatellaceae cyanobacterium]